MRTGAACLLSLCLAAPIPAFARDTLPWKDANPVERATPRAKAKPHTRKAEAPDPTAAAGAVPRPEARPEAPAQPEPARADSATPVAGAPPPAADVAKPEPRPADASQPDAPMTDAPKPPAAEATEPATEQTGAASRPLDEIPVPDKRPAPTAAEAPSEAGATGPAAAEPVPEPTSPPAAEAPNSTEKLKARETEVTPAASVEAAAAVEDSIACEAELKKRGVDFAVEETISEGDCGVLRPVALKRLSSGVEVTPRTQMLCRTALALDEWMTTSVVPSAKTELPSETLAEFRHASTYVCRPRASESGISEHARGSAIDIGGFVFKSGREIGVAAKEAGSPDERFLETVRKGACGPFRTVLGPGTDKDHATHFHLDIAARTNGATYCR